MTRSVLKWGLPSLLIAVLFFGCGKKPGEELYYDALKQWESGNTTRARALLEKSIRRRPGSIENADAYNRLGLLLWEMGEQEEAVNAFTESLRMDPEQYDVRCNQGVALCGVKDFAQAEAAFREAALMNPSDPRPLAYAGVVFAQNQKWDEAYRNLSKAVTRTPNNAELQTALALVELQRQGSQPTDALKRLRNVTEKHPNYVPALFNMGSVYRYKLKNPAEAKAWYQRYLDRSSGTDGFSAFARTQIERLNDPAAIPKLTYRPPVTRDRAASQDHFSRAVALHQEGKVADAIREYVRAIEADDTYERAFYNLGLAYYTNGQMVLAGEAFSKAVDLNPAYTDARYNLALVCHYHLGDTPRALREIELLLRQKPNYQPAIDLRTQIRQ